MLEILCIFLDCSLAASFSKASQKKDSTQQSSEVSQPFSQSTRCRTYLCR
uniref:Uncharacterized protein n=1 Tax=Anguilla anguilla TaxID=7936 RepID=A0A0E9VST8_ANGAN